MSKQLVLLFLLNYSLLPAQKDINYPLEFNFNDHEVKEAKDRIKIRAPGTYLTTDRFGNEESALYLQGTNESYLNLGTSELLKCQRTTISIWVNITRRVYMGKGYEVNPIFLTKNSAEDDYYVAYAIGYDAYVDRFAGSATKDITMEAVVTAKKPAQFGKWCHLVLACDKDSLAFYVNGELQERVKKGFETVFLASDSVIVGHSANKKNLRYSQGYFDDIQIFNRVLSDKEVMELYEAPNPSRYRIILDWILKCILVIAGIIAVAFLLVARHKKRLQQEQEKFEMKSKMSEMEIRIIKAQINPHFMSNCLSAVQNLIAGKKLDEANQYIAKFALLVRQVLNFSTLSLVSLKDELELIRLNVDLEQLRFENIFVFNVQVEAGIDPASIFVPPLIFQPIIENAIWHGLLPLKGEWTARLDLRVRKEGDALITTIEDNGVGRKNRKGSIGNSKSKGIKITTQRIGNINHLYHTKTAYIVFEDLHLKKEGLPGGTRVTISLPLKLTPDTDD
jgi:hypothetical protein